MKKLKKYLFAILIIFNFLFMYEIFSLNASVEDLRDNLRGAAELIEKLDNDNDTCRSELSKYETVEVMELGQ